MAARRERDGASARRRSAPSATTDPRVQTAGPPAARARARGQVAIRPDFDLGRLIDAIRPHRPVEFRLPVRRPDDLVVFDLLVENLELKTDGSPRLEKQDPSADAHLVVELPPQSFAEEAFLQVSNADTDLGTEVSSDPEYPKKNIPRPREAVPPLPSARVRMARPSRLVFSMPPTETSLPYTLAAVLEAMRTWPLRLGLNALPDPELPFGFLEVPTLGGWLTSTVTSAGWRATRVALAAELQAIGARGIAPALAAAGQRIAERAAGGLADRAGGSLGRAMFDAMQGEVAELQRRFPALREGPAHQAGLAALSLAGTEALAAAAARTEVGMGAAFELPILPLLLAPHEPARDVTALELPHRLILSPIEEARWLHRDVPVVHSGRTELWHTRLTTAADDFGPDGPAKVRALWSPDYPITDFLPLLAPRPLPFRTSLDPLDRKMLVKLMAGYSEKRPNGRPYRPRSSQAKRLHLSALGGLLDAEGNWSPRPRGVDLEQWRHLATLGRDHYVRVVYAGFLCPFGHAASLVKVTERMFESLDGDPTRRIAVLRQRFFIVVRERVRHYAGADHEFNGHNFPFSRVEVLTRFTPDLLEPGKGQSALEPANGDVIYGGEIVERMAFWPMVPSTIGSGAEDVTFEIMATDLDGQRTSFAVPLLFVSEVVNRQKGEPVRRAYNAETVSRRRADLGSATVCYAPFDPGDVGDSRLPTASMTFAAGKLTEHKTTEPNFYPETSAAAVGIPPLQKLLGRTDAVVEVTYPEVYKHHRFGELDPAQNQGKVFLQLINQAHRLEFGGGPGQARSDALGALAAPQMAILGLSKIMGPVAATEPANPSDPKAIEHALKKVIGKDATGNPVAPTFDPVDFFKGATILGGVELATILDVATGLAGADVPKLVSRELPATAELPERIEASFAWETLIAHPDPLKLLVPGADPGKPPTKLTMNGRVLTPLADPGAATYEAVAELTNFKVNLFGFIIIWFERLRFDARQGQKPDVAVELRQGEDAVQFGGPLEFVNELRSLIPSNGFSDPPALAVTPSGINASYSLNLPTIGVGVFSLSNASLGAGFNLPFDSRPASVQFRFSERHHPFSLTVSLLGGGGFFGIGVSARGVQEIEAALEFGAAVAIDLVVASGSVEVKAGIYFHWLEKQPGKSTVELAGYVRIYGELSVLGLISASLTFNLQLAYRKEPGASIVWGEATLIVEVEVLVFSADVSVRCRREFAGGKSDPKFIDLIPDADTWTEYCEAFAEEAA